jgi:cell division septation protein DedD
MKGRGACLSAGAPTLIFFLFVAFAAPAAAQASVSALPAAPADLKEAALRLAKASSPAEYATMLNAFSSALPPSDALTLLSRALASTDARASLPSEYRKPLLVKAGDLALLLGLFADAATNYEAAAVQGTAPGDKGDELLIRSARCFIAAGDYENAARISSNLVASAKDPLLAVDARLVVAWSLALQGRTEDAKASLGSIPEIAGVSAVARPGQRREARFIQWLCAADKAAAAAALAAEFPGSPEALISAGKASLPPLPHWYLGALAVALSVPGLPFAQGISPAASPEAPPASPKADGAQVESGKRLQVGFFSVEDNARALRDELRSKRFEATIEVRQRASSPGKTGEKRWIVVVDGGKDIAKTMQSLKDAGYESYEID